MGDFHPQCGQTAFRPKSANAVGVCNRRLWPYSDVYQGHYRAAGEDGLYSGIPARRM